MADKYYKESDKTTKRIFGKENITNSEIMSLMDKKDGESQQSETE